MSRGSWTSAPPRSSRSTPRCSRPRGRRAWSSRSARTRAATEPSVTVTLVARITFLVLVGATFAAFFVAQRLKSAPPVITVASLNRDFSPALHEQEFSIFLKNDDDVTVDVVTQDGDRVRRLADDVHVVAHRALRLRWDGREDDGTQ